MLLLLIDFVVVVAAVASGDMPFAWLANEF